MCEQFLNSLFCYFTSWVGNWKRAILKAAKDNGQNRVFSDIRELGKSIWSKVFLKITPQENPRLQSSVV